MNQKLLARLIPIRDSLAMNRSQRRNTRNEIGDALNQTLALCAAKVSDPETAELLSALNPVEVRYDAPYTVDSDTALVLCDTIINLLKATPIPPTDRQDKQEQNSSAALVERVVPSGRQVFVIHGHDYENTMRLRDLLKERFGLTPIILSDKPEKGRTVIEKFEEEAKVCAFAFAIMTPDDVVQAGGITTSQARPNVVFELGWFYGRLGRRRVCILFKKGTSIQSDLNGVLRIEFVQSVTEKVLEIERELKEASLF